MAEAAGMLRWRAPIGRAMWRRVMDMAGAAWTRPMAREEEFLGLDCGISEGITYL